MVFFVLFVVPTFSSFFYSLTRWTLFDWHFIGLDNFKAFFQEPALTKALRNTLVYAVVTSGLKVVLGMSLAVMMTSQIIARGYLRSVIFFPVLVSTVGVGITFTALMHPPSAVINATRTRGSTGRAGWSTPKLALLSVAMVDVWKGVGLATVIYIASIVSIPREYFEAAPVDGGGRSQVPGDHPAAGPAGHHDRDHPVADRRAAVVRSHLVDDPRRPRLHLRRDRVGHLQAVPGRVLLLEAGNVVLFVMVAVIIVPLVGLPQSKAGRSVRRPVHIWRHPGDPRFGRRLRHSLLLHRRQRAEGPA